MLDPWKITIKAEEQGLRKLTDLAERAGVSVGAMSSVLGYRRASASPERIALALDCEVEDIDSDVEEFEVNRRKFRRWVAAGRPCIVIEPL